MKKIFLFSILASFCMLSACKQDPEYVLKDPRGKQTVAAVGQEHFEDKAPLRIPRKYLDRGKLKERNAKNYFIQKKMREARLWEP